VGVEEESTSMARRSTAESLVDSIAESSLRMLECSVGAALCLLDTASLLFIGARERGVQRRLCAVAIRQSNEDSGPRSAAPSGSAPESGCTDSATTPYLVASLLGLDIWGAPHVYVIFILVLLSRLIVTPSN
jgi:hypothetical protein